MQRRGLGRPSNHPGRPLFGEKGMHSAGRTSVWCIFVRRDYYYPMNPTGPQITITGDR